VISCDWISKKSQCVSVLDSWNFSKFFVSWFEEGRIVNVGGFFIPFEMNWFLRLELIPSFGSCWNLAVSLLKNFRFNCVQL
jgi:hypothetical protein